MNIDKLRYTGVEVQGGLGLGHGFSVGASWTHLHSKDVLDPSNPVGETYADKLTGQLRYRSRGGRWWVEYAVRHNGEQKDVALGTSPVGPVLPSFTVHAVRGGIRVLSIGPVTHTLSFALENLTNRLYAEFANVSFFRPEPARTLTMTWTAGF